MINIIISLISIITILFTMNMLTKSYYKRVLSEAIVDSEKGLSKTELNAERIMLPNLPMSKTFISGQDVNQVGKWIDS